MTRKFHYLTINTFVQATEDRNKVLTALRNLIGELPEDGILEDEVEGIHHNPIIGITISFKKEKEIKRIISGWKAEEFWKGAMEQKEERLDDSQIFHIRIDKEAAHEGDLRLWKSGEAIGIKLKIATYPTSWEAALKALDGIMEG